MPKLQSFINDDDNQPQVSEIPGERLFVISPPHLAWRDQVAIVDEQANTLVVLGAEFARDQDGIRVSLDQFAKNVEAKDIAGNSLILARASQYNRSQNPRLANFKAGIGIYVDSKPIAVIRTAWQKADAGSRYVITCDPCFRTRSDWKLLLGLLYLDMARRDFEGTA